MVKTRKAETACKIIPFPQLPGYRRCQPISAYDLARKNFGFDRNVLLRVMKAHPLLTYSGIGELETPYQATPKGRQKLLDAKEEIDAALDWLSRQERRKTINPHWSSYGLKHIAERATGTYIANGSFIAAALMDGWTVKRCASDSPNALLNISERALKKLLSENPNLLLG